MIEIQGTDPTMIANNLTPAYPTHPGEVLKDEIEYRKLSQRKLAEQMGISYKMLNDILNCRRTAADRLRHRQPCYSRLLSISQPIH